MPRTFKAHKPPSRPLDPLNNHPNAGVQQLENGELTFIHRPPPTSPTPFSTTEQPSSPLLLAPTASAKGAVRLPPLLRPSAYVKPPPRVSDTQLAEIKRLRAEDPAKYTRGRLAKMFGCTNHFVALVAALPPAERKRRVKEMEAERETNKAQWGHRRSLIAEIRAKRKTFW